MKRLAVVLCVMAIAVFVCGCASSRKSDGPSAVCMEGARHYVRGDFDKQPEWVDHPGKYKTAKTWTYTGLSSEVIDEAEARILAAENAAEQIAMFVSTSVHKEVDRVTRTVGIPGQAYTPLAPAVARQSIVRLLSSERIMQDYTNEVWVQEWATCEAGHWSAEHTYKVYSLVEYPDSEMDRLRADAVQQYLDDAKAQRDKAKTERREEDLDAVLEQLQALLESE